MLELQTNRINVISTDQLEMAMLYSLTLHGNPIKIIEPIVGIFGGSGLCSQLYVTLHDNPWHCNPSIMWLKDFKEVPEVDPSYYTGPGCRVNTVYPKKYAHGFVVLCFVVVMQSFIMNSHEVFIHIHQGCFAGTGAIVRLPQCQWSKPDGYGKISQCITTTKHSKAKTVCIFLGIYCIFDGPTLVCKTPLDLEGESLWTAGSKFNFSSDIVF